VLANLNTVTDKTVVNAKNDLTATLRGSLDKDDEEEEQQRVGRTGGTN
jgi:hypothetical protein